MLSHILSHVFSKYKMYSVTSLDILFLTRASFFFVLKTCFLSLYFIFIYIFIDFSLFTLHVLCVYVMASNKEQKVGGSRWEGWWEGTGGSRGRRTIIRIDYVRKKLFLIKGKKIKFQHRWKRGF